MLPMEERKKERNCLLFEASNWLKSLIVWSIDEVVRRHDIFSSLVDFVCAVPFF